MIRKFLLFSSLIVLSLWVVGAHIVKSRVRKEIESSSTQNLSISYKDIKIAGFPFGWKIRLISPQLVDTNAVTHFKYSADEVSFKFNYLLDKVSINIGKILTLALIHDREEPPRDFLNSEEDMIIDVNFKKSLALSDAKNYRLETKIVKLDNRKIVYTHNDGQIIDFDLLNLYFDVNDKNDVESLFDIKANIDSSYELPFNDIHLSSHITYHNEDAESAHEFNITRIDVMLDKEEESQMHFKGNVGISKNGVHLVDIHSKIENYSKIINKIPFYGTPINLFSQVDYLINQSNDANERNWHIKFNKKDGLTINDIKTTDL